MCGRFTLRQPDQLTKRFDATWLELPGLGELGARFNVAPTQFMPIVVEGEAGRTLELARWGLVPAWAKDPAIGNKMINARAETLAEKPSFRGALRSRRCLVPADGFFEWKWEEKGAGTPGKRSRQPYFIHRRDDALFAFAGLYERWRDPAGHVLTTFTIISTTPNALMATLHDRMAVMLLPEQEEEWLAPDLVERGHWPALLQPYPDDLLDAYPISTLVNSPHNDTPEVLEPAA
jgi:putative SOS response-associated peptidase YedK